LYVYACDDIDLINLSHSNEKKRQPNRAQNCGCQPNIDLAKQKIVTPKRDREKEREGEGER